MSSAEGQYGFKFARCFLERAICATWRRELMKSKKHCLEFSEKGVLVLAVLQIILWSWASHSTFLSLRSFLCRIRWLDTTNSKIQQHPWHLNPREIIQIGVGNWHLEAAAIWGKMNTEKVLCYILHVIKATFLLENIASVWFATLLLFKWSCQLPSSL